MIAQKTVNAIKIKYETLKTELDERSRRMWATAEAESLGYGGVTVVSKTTSIAESTIRLGRHEVKRDSLGKQVGNIRKISSRRSYC